MLRSLTTTLVALAIAGCGQQPVKTPPTVNLGISRPPSLLSGCPLPDSALIASSAPLEVVMALSIAEDGIVGIVEVTKTSGSSELDKAFIAAARACLFAPALVNGKPTTSSREIAFQWQSKLPPSGINRCFQPDYPRQAARADAQGIAEVQFIFVSATAPPDVKLVRSSGSNILDRESVLSATRCLSNENVRKSLKENQSYRQAISWILQ